MNFESTCFFNCTTSKTIFFYETDLNNQFAITFNNCCFYNLNSSTNIIQAHSQLNIYQSTIINNPTNNILFNTKSSKMMLNNISFNSLHTSSKLNDNEFLCFYDLTKEKGFDIQYNSFVCNKNGPYLINYVNYASSSIFYSSIINNSVVTSLIYLSNVDSSSYSILTINHCAFANNVYRKAEFLDIFRSGTTNTRLTVFSCLIGTTLPSQNNHDNYFYIDNKESITFILDNENIWNNTNIYEIKPPSPSKDYICQLISNTSPTQTPTSTLSQTPTSSISQTDDVNSMPKTIAFKN